MAKGSLADAAATPTPIALTKAPSAAGAAVVDVIGPEATAGDTRTATQRTEAMSAVTRRAFIGHLQTMALMVAPRARARVTFARNNYYERVRIWNAAVTIDTPRYRSLPVCGRIELKPSGKTAPFPLSSR